MEEAQARIQREVTAMFSDLHKNVIRKIEGDAYRCSAACCDDKSASNEVTQSCIERCSEGSKKIQDFTQNEVQTFENRLQRCGMDCQDKAKDKYRSGMSMDEQRKLQKEVEQCAMNCIDTHIKLLSGISKRISDFAANYK